jgi:hypothetical protein
MNGKFMANSWELYGNYMGIIWEIGNYMGIIWEIGNYMGIIWDIFMTTFMEIDGFMTRVNFHGKFLWKCSSRTGGNSS